MFAGILQSVFLFAYVTGSSSFPEALKPEEEQKYLAEYANGSIEAQNILIEHNLRLVAHIVKKYTSIISKDADDLISIGSVGLIKAIKSFDPSKGTRLATYASRCIENAMVIQR